MPQWNVTATTWIWLCVCARVCVFCLDLCGHRSHKGHQQLEFVVHVFWKRERKTSTPQSCCMHYQAGSQVRHDDWEHISAHLVVRSGGRESPKKTTSGFSTPPHDGQAGTEKVLVVFNSTSPSGRCRGTCSAPWRVLRRQRRLYQENCDTIT